MKLVYCDEAGDPGYPKYESPCFFLTFLYMNAEDWDKCFEHLLKTRRDLRSEGLPLRLEFHSREFFLNKNPYTRLKLSNHSRIKIIDTLIDSIAQLSQFNVRSINVAIAKKRITSRYDVLDKAFSYGLTRIDTDLYKEKTTHKYSKFLILVDEGYLHKTRKICRKLRRFNYVPYEGGQDTRPLNLKAMVDDPSPKDSKFSYFIQTADLIAYLISQYVYIKFELNTSPKRKRFIADEKIIEWVDKLDTIFNIQACPQSELGHGIVVHPQ